MAGLSDFIGMASKQLGISAGAAESGAGGLFAMLKDKVGAADFGKVAAAIPGVEDAMRKAPTGGGGALGGLMAAAGKVLGGSAGQAATVGAMLQKAGIGTDKAQGFAAMLFNFVRSKLSPELLTSIMGKLGDLGKLL